MKQYTNESQTAKLMELGLPRPRCLHDCVLAYNIGELIEMLPMEDRVGERSMVYDGLEWVVNWDNDDGTINQVVATELIDALYDMVIVLKRQGITPND